MTERSGHQVLTDRLDSLNAMIAEMAHLPSLTQIAASLTRLTTAVAALEQRLAALEQECDFLQQQAMARWWDTPP